MKHIGLFEGIGGFSLAARWMGWETIAWCEWNEFGQKVLKYHFPKANAHGNIKETDFTIYRGQCDIVTGGFPCQPYSQAGKRKGKEDDRHLWPEMLRAIREIQPTWVVGENVLGLVNWSGGLVFHEVQTDLEAAGYEVFPYVLPACAVNAPHRRDRVWFVAYSNSCRNNRTNRSKSSIRKSESEVKSRNRGASEVNGLSNERVITNTESRGLEGQRQHRKISGIKRNIRPVCVNERTVINDDTNTGGIGWDKGINVNGNIKDREEGRQFCTTDSPHNWSEWPTQSPIRFRNDGLPPKLDGITFPKWVTESIKAAGNAIVPQVALQIFKTIDKYEKILNP